MNLGRAAVPRCVWHVSLSLTYPGEGKGAGVREGRRGRLEFSTLSAADREYRDSRAARASVGECVKLVLSFSLFYSSSFSFIALLLSHLCDDSDSKKGAQGSVRFDRSLEIALSFILTALDALRSVIVSISRGDTCSNSV